MTSMRGIFWCDPGKSSGCSWGIFNLRSRTVADAMRDRIESGSETFKTTDHTTEAMMYHARSIWGSWSRFKKNCVNKGMMDPDQIVLGMEHFILTSMHSSGVEGIFPAFVIGAFEGYRGGLYDNHRNRTHRHYTPLVLQPAPKGLRYNKRQFLEPWGCWIRGREHERAAFAHIGAYLMDKIR